MQFGSDWNSVKLHQSDGFAGLLGRKGRLIQRVRGAEQRQINENGMEVGNVRFQTLKTDPVKCHVLRGTCVRPSLYY